MLKIAVPNKGSLAEAASTMLRAAGYRQRTDSKDLILVDSAHDVEFYYLRPRDIAVYVEEGHLDVGITGRDMLLDSGARATELLSLGFGGSRFRFAAPAGPTHSVEEMAGRRIATSYPGLLGRWLAEHGRSVPGEVAVVGIDDVDGSDSFLPPLTTIRQPHHEVGACAVGHLAELIGGRPARHTILEPELIIRESTKGH